jgi:putative flippase GtrA
MVLSEVFKYAIAGVVNTAAGYGVFWIALRGLHLSPEAANAIGYVIALGVAFLLNRFFVFTGARISVPTGMRFLVAFIVAFALNHGVLVLLVRNYSVLPEVAQIFAMIVYTMSFYVLNKYFVFAVRHLD